MKYLAASVLLQVGLTLAFSLPNIARLSRREVVEDKGDHILICRQEPLELGIVLDSSSSLRNRDFKTAIKFLQEFLSQYEISSDPNGVRVSIISYGKGIYPEIGFNLTTYDTKDEVIEAIGRIPHKAGLRTDTGRAIQYMHEAQLANGVVRPGVTKVSIVITDGNSQEWKLTKEAAEEARKDNIVMFAIGVGTDIRNSELLNIAGDQSRVTKVDNYNQLSSIKESLAHQTCFVQEKTTTTPVPMDEPCGVSDPADIFFVFSPANLGSDGTLWATSFIGLTVDTEDLNQGFRYGVLSGSCPDDAGFNLDAYSTVEGIKNRLESYERNKVQELVKTLADDGFTTARGARANSRKIAVIIAAGKKTSELQDEVAALVAQNIQVFVADPADKGLTLEGATILSGRSSKLQAEAFVSALCPKRS
uniref:Matrilin n=1 Tax=Biomphalaria glabrata TaxID=6526 RepID=Q3YJV2_BIOGL|nr:matrilin [Biomphalaria glabrata]